MGGMAAAFQAELEATKEFLTNWAAERGAEPRARRHRSEARGPCALASMNLPSINQLTSTV